MIESVDVEFVDVTVSLPTRVEFIEGEIVAFVSFIGTSS